MICRYVSFRWVHLNFGFISLELNFVEKTSSWGTGGRWKCGRHRQQEVDSFLYSRKCTTFANSFYEARLDMSWGKPCIICLLQRLFSTNTLAYLGNLFRDVLWPIFILPQLYNCFSITTPNVLRLLLGSLMLTGPHLSHYQEGCQPVWPVSK